jgi:hypothetical protein
MSRTAWVPDFGASDSLYQQVEVPEPGDPGYPGRPLPESDPGAAAWNRALAEVEAEAAQRVSVTEICGPEPDNGIQRLHSPMREPEREAEAEAADEPDPWAAEYDVEPEASP